MSYRLSQLNQTGIPGLLEGIDSLAAWERKGEHIRARWLKAIGEIPDRVPVNVQVLSEQILADHKRLHLRYDTVHDDTVTAYLLLPLSPQESGCKWPVILALHPTVAEGKDDIATERARQNRQYALELVVQGYAVLAPDALTAGERIYPGYPDFHNGPFYDRHPDWSLVAKNICDHRQALDVLCSLECVDSEAIGAIGHSFGAYNAYFLAGIDTRVKAIVSSCGVSPFTGDPHPEHWGERPFPYTHIPSVTEGLREDVVPFEFNEIMALCAPTPFFVYSAQDDRIFPHWQSVGDTILDVARLYRWLGAEDDFQGLLGDGKHDFPPSIRRLAYDFLHRKLLHDSGGTS